MTQTEPKPLIYFILFHVINLHTKQCTLQDLICYQKYVDLKQRAGVTDLTMLLWYVFEGVRFIFKTIAGIKGTLSFQKKKKIKESR